MLYATMKESYLSLLVMALTGSINHEAGACDWTSPGGCTAVQPMDPKKRFMGNDRPPWGQIFLQPHKNL